MYVYLQHMHVYTQAGLHVFAIHMYVKCMYVCTHVWDVEMYEAYVCYVHAYVASECVFVGCIRIHIHVFMHAGLYICIYANCMCVYMCMYIQISMQLC